MTRDELLASLNAERYGTGDWFKTPQCRPRLEPISPDIFIDTDLTTARRRRELVGDDHQTRIA